MMYNMRTICVIHGDNMHTICVIRNDNIRTICVIHDDSSSKGGFLTFILNFHIKEEYQNDFQFV